MCHVETLNTKSIRSPRKIKRKILSPNKSCSPDSGKIKLSGTFKSKKEEKLEESRSSNNEASNSNIETIKVHNKRKRAKSRQTVKSKSRKISNDKCDKKSTEETDLDLNLYDNDFLDDFVP